MGELGKAVFFKKAEAAELAKFILALNAELANYFVEYYKEGWYVTVK